ncbi:hypothetical protein ONZ43_g3095 [Nemania bipapillata]|uniref:Uncharacterized protein n=1 Tax=Nemania bipapillata TaxID=110536 RepID=A0ACC2IYH2_9PEZI|nr:hypothetical protein ONZ43_g3095 [Nemania bipapillata]
MNLLSPNCSLKLLATAVLLTFGVNAGCTNEKGLHYLRPARRRLPPNVISNGDFECGFAPWTVQVPDPAANYYVGTPSYSGSYSFQVHFTPPAVSPQYGVSARIISAAATVQPNVPYVLNFWTWFDNGDAGFIGVMINDVAIYTIDARDHGYNGPFTNNTLTYTPTTSSVTLKFEFLFGNVASWDRIDDVTFVPA